MEFFGSRDEDLETDAVNVNGKVFCEVTLGGDFGCDEADRGDEE